MYHTAVQQRTAVPLHRIVNISPGIAVCGRGLYQVQQYYSIIQLRAEGNPATFLRPPTGTTAVLRVLLLL